MVNPRESNYPIGSVKWYNEKINMSFPELVRWLYDIQKIYYDNKETLLQYRQKCKGLIPLTILKEISNLSTLHTLYGTHKNKEEQFAQNIVDKSKGIHRTQAKIKYKIEREGLIGSQSHENQILYNYLMESWGISATDKELFQIISIAKNSVSLDQSKQEFPTELETRAHYGKSI
jgi:hypothetical protein